MRTTPEGLNSWKITRSQEGMFNTTRTSSGARAMRGLGHSMTSQQHTGGVLFVSRRASFSWCPCPCPCLCPWSPRPVGVRQHEQSRKHSPLIYGSVQKYTSDTNERTTNEIPFNRRGFSHKGGCNSHFGPIWEGAYSKCSPLLCGRKLFF